MRERELSDPVDLQTGREVRSVAARADAAGISEPELVEADRAGDPDIDLWYADESTGAEDAAITSLSNQVQMLNSGDLAAGSVLGIPVPPAASKFMYLVTGAATNADYTAGKILIEFFGYDA